MEETIGSTLKKAATETLTSTRGLGEQTGEAISSATESLRRRLPDSGKVGDAADAVARGVKQTTGYLQEEGLSGIVEDVEVLIRRYPLQTLLVGVGCGYLLSRLRPN